MRTTLTLRPFVGRLWMSLVCAGLMLAMAPAAAAAGRDCKLETDSGERMKCMFGKVIAQQRTTTDMAIAMGEFPDMTPTEAERLERYMDRTAKSVERTKGPSFKMITNQGFAKCQMLPFLADDEDGICTGNEVCQEVIDDDIGNDDGMCETKGKPSDREVCTEICDQGAITDPRNFDDDADEPNSFAADMEEELDDLMEAYIEVEDSMGAGRQTRAALVALAMADGDGSCAAVLAERRSNAQLTKWLTISVIASTVSDICDSACGNDIAGFNCLAVCGITAGLTGAAELTNELYQNEDGNIDSDHIDATLECVVGLMSGLTDLNDKLDEVIDLLNTPPGRRRDFPGGTQPDPEPDPAAERSRNRRAR